MVISETNFWDFTENWLELYCNIPSILFLYSNAKKKKRYGLFLLAFNCLIELRHSVDETRHPTTDAWVKPLIVYLCCPNYLLGRIIWAGCNSTSHKHEFSPFLFYLSALHEGKISKLNNSNEGSASLLVQTGVTHQSWWSSTSLHWWQMPLKISRIHAAAVSQGYGNTASAIWCKTIYSLRI